MAGKRRIWILILALVLLSGCRLQNQRMLTETAQVTQIQGAQTLVASLSLTPQSTATAVPTTSLPPTDTPTPSFTPVSTSGTSTPFATPTSGSSGDPCDDARFVSDVSIPDGTEMDPGETFTKTWRIENAGTCEWTEDYSVNFLSGDKLEGESTQISGTVEPGETYDVSIDMKAPFEAGTYTGTWTIMNESGFSFGNTFYVEIEVTSSATATPTPTQTPTASETPTVTTPPTETPTPEATPSPESSTPSTESSEE